MFQCLPKNNARRECQRKLDERVVWAGSIQGGRTGRAIIISFWIKNPEWKYLPVLQ